MIKSLSRKNKLILFLLVFFIFTTANACLSNFLGAKLQSGWSFESAILNLSFIKNTGAAFSIMHDSPNFLIILAIVAIVITIFYVLKHLEKLPLSAVFWSGLLVSGICGNLFERIYFGYVRDFFELAFVPFPVFNISDVYINLSVFAIIFLLVEKKYF